MTNRIVRLIILPFMVQTAGGFTSNVGVPVIQLMLHTTTITALKKRNMTGRQKKAESIRNMPTPTTAGYVPTICIMMNAPENGVSGMIPEIVPI